MRHKSSHRKKKGNKQTNKKKFKPHILNSLALSLWKYLDRRWQRSVCFWMSHLMIVCICGCQSLTNMITGVVIRCLSLPGKTCT